MRIAVEWLDEFVKIDIDHQSLAKKLTMAGFEVEAIEKGISLSIKGSCDMPYVFEVNVTPNRPDCLSILGLAREVSAITGSPIKLPEIRPIKEEDFSFDIEIKEPSLCKRYTGRVIKGVRVEESPSWLKDRLQAVGLRPINNIVDITNYVLIEFGQPLHAFDLSLLKGKIIVKPTESEIPFKTLDGQIRDIPKGSLMIWDSEKPVAIAGIMGGAETEVFLSTKDIFLESAWFEPKSIRKTSKAVGLRTESSYRFEREVDIENVLNALDRATELIIELSGGKAGKKTDIYPQRYIPLEIRINPEKISKVLGMSISDNKVIERLERLGFFPTTEGDIIKVSVPSFRPDITSDIDIIEEIARLIGYENIPTSMPRSTLYPAKVPRHINLIKKIKTSMRLYGFNEAINFSFMNPKDIDLLGISHDDKRKKAVAIKNPLRSEESLLRTTLVPSLIENFRYNFFRGIEDIRIFEASRVFFDLGKALPEEAQRLGAILCIPDSKNLWKEKIDEFYLLKGVLEALFSEIKLSEIGFRRSKEPFLHPGKSADVFNRDKKIGFIGLLLPSIGDTLDLKKRLNIAVFEIDLDTLIENAPKAISYKEIPKFPYIERDIAIVVDKETPSEEIISLIKDYPSEFIEEAFVFDVYSGEGIPEGKKSLAFSVRYRSKKHTLTDEEIEKIHSSLLRHIINGTKGQLRQ